MFIRHSPPKKMKAINFNLRSPQAACQPAAPPAPSHEALNKCQCVHCHGELAKFWVFVYSNVGHRPLQHISFHPAPGESVMQIKVDGANTPLKQFTLRTVLRTWGLHVNVLRHCVHNSVLLACRSEFLNSIAPSTHTFTLKDCKGFKPGEEHNTPPLMAM